MWIVRASVLLAVTVWSSVAILAVAAFAGGTAKAFVQHPGLTQLGVLLGIAVPAYAWFAFFGLSVGWLFQRRISKRWVFSGIASGIASLALAAALAVPLLMYVFPSVLFASYVCWFHLERGEEASIG